MRKILLGLALAFIALPVSAQTRGQNAARCVATDPEPSIAGCTALIQSGQEPSADLVVEYYNRGNAYERKQLWDQAIADYTQAIVLNPRYADAFDNRGIAYDNEDRYDQAIADYTQAIALNPRMARAFTNRGMSYDNEDRNDQAIADYTQAIALNPRDADAYYHRGVDHEDKGLRDQAIADYRTALKINPSLTKAKVGLIELGAAQ